MAINATFGRVGTKPAHPKNNGTNPQGQTALCARTGFADDFLKEVFTPSFADDSGFLDDYRMLEKDFFTSLGYLKDLYGIKTENVSDYAFPLNILKAYESAKAQLEEKEPELGLIIVSNKTSWAALATYRTVDIRQTLYYISLRPIFDLFKDKSKIKLTSMLMSVYAYLKDILKVPFYLYPNAYVCWVYDCFKEYVREEINTGEDDYYKKCAVVLQNAEHKGRAFLKKIWRQKHLEDFGERVEHFVPSDKIESKIHNLCKGFYSLYKKYPKRSIKDSIRNGLLEPQEEYRMYFQHYLSFAWDMNDCMTENIIEHINTDLQETAVIDAPMSVQVFDLPHKKVCLNISFEKKLFKLINELNCLLD